MYLRLTRLVTLIFLLLYLCKILLSMAIKPIPMFKNSDLANLLDRLSSQRTTVPNRLDREATVVQFYKSNGTVSVQMSFQLAWSISKDVADMICAIPTGFNPSAARWVNSDTSNTGKNIQFNVKQNENGVWCLYLTALDNLTATDRINDSFMYQL